MLCAPGKMHEPKPLDSFVNISGDTLCANNQQSTLQIAASASIVTSLIITLVIWIFSDGRTIGTRAVQSLTSVQSTASESQYTNNPSRDLTPKELY